MRADDRGNDLQLQENEMASDMADDAQWVEDVRRWVAAQSRSGDEADTAELGYEAADPALQARHWPDPISPREPYRSI